MLASRGIAVPRGILWPSAAPDTSPDGWLVKAQVLQGRRGVRGGVVRADDLAAANEAAFRISQMKFDGELPRAVFLEEWVSVTRELYLAVFVSRDSGCISVLASARGGIEIELVPSDQVHRINIDPLVGIQSYQTRRIAMKLGLFGSEIGRHFQTLVRTLYELLLAEDAELIEINPIGVTDQGQLVALDAKVVLDDDAMVRHPMRTKPNEWQSDGAFMQRTRDLGAIGIDLTGGSPPEPGNGAIAVLGNGAGLTMATFDLVRDRGGRVCAVIEMHGALAKGIPHTADLIETFSVMNPDVVLLNAFYQLRSCDDFAAAVVTAVSRTPAWIDPAHVVVRVRGVNDDRAIGLLQGAGCHATRSLTEAIALTVALADRAISVGVES